jgi:hypothetical protein
VLARLYIASPGHTQLRYPPRMPLVTLQGAELAFGLHPLLDRAEFAVEEG